MPRHPSLRSCIIRKTCGHRFFDITLLHYYRCLQAAAKACNDREWCKPPEKWRRKVKKGR